MTHSQQEMKHIDKVFLFKFFLFFFRPDQENKKGPFYCNDSYPFDEKAIMVLLFMFDFSLS